MKFEHRNARGALGLACALSMTLLGCSATGTSPAYSKALVEPISIVKHSDDALILRYRVSPESGFYSGGVDYERVDDDLRVVIARCKVGGACEPMAKSRVPLDEKWQAEVRLPGDARRVIVVHSDGEAQVYP